MLSRFSKLPGISSLLSSNPCYPQALIDGVVADIKNLGRNGNDSDDTLQAITKILSLMKKYSDSIQIQRVSCHALSNLAMQVVVARWIVQKGGFQLIRRALTKFESDSKICWLGSSAIWNLARPPANRAIIGKAGVKIMLRMLQLHQSKEKVTNTTIGALSNLSLDESLKDVIAEPANVELILSVLSKYVKQSSASVLTSGAGLLANLAVSDNHASLLVGRCSLPILLHLLRWSGENVDETLYRNTCAALNNMVTADDFLDRFLETRGVEKIFDFLEANNNELYTNLLENCLVNLDVDSAHRTTSLHACSLHGRIKILHALLKEAPLSNLDAVDGKNMSCLDYALSMGHSDVAEFLSKCGATKYQESYVEEGNKSAELKAAINAGRATLKFVTESNVDAIYKKVTIFPKEMCALITSFNSDIDMLEGMNSFC